MILTEEMGVGIHQIVEGLKMELPSNVKNVHTEREDPSQFITHRAKDFVTSMKEIEHRFFRTFESGERFLGF
ncbi:hypothetical protein Ahy_A10g050241 [Arachis hypogaea]|uniref:Uncharacterized protein n=1 Tax=Arachis hypogaea TaxID=3818 RepID=A0A445B8U8_ARAHY|nr:hypothetical protein Ahy_A10g050241 [Arachis hypogaea]